MSRGVRGFKENAAKEEKWGLKKLNQRVIKADEDAVRERSSDTRAHIHEEFFFLHEVW